MKRLLTAAALPVVLLLTGCNSSLPHVVSKTYTPPYAATVPCGDGCVGTRQVNYPECWGVQLDNRESMCVSQAVWQAARIGAEFDPEAAR